MFLLDTNVLPASAPKRAAMSPELERWFARNTDRLFLSVVTIAEVDDGIAKATREGATRKADQLSEWLEAILQLYGRRVLPIEIATARRAGALSDRARANGHAPGFADLMIAATASVLGYVVLTRNIKHFAVTGVAACDPFSTLPS